MANESIFAGPGDPFDIIYGKLGGQLSLTANRMVQDFTITTDSYVLMCTHLYEVLCTEKSEFADKISESAFQYYAIMLLWQRISHFLPPRSRKLSPFLNKLPDFEPCLTGIPKSLEKYLDGIGNFQHPYLGEMRFSLPEPLISQSFDLATGTFGKVSADTHFLYEAFPAPGIAALRILADISITNNMFGDSSWDLPKDLRPDFGDDPSVKGQAKPEPKPTINLLGWAPAQPLTKNQLELFRSSGIESTVSHSDMTQFFDNSKELLKTISRYFHAASKPPSVQPVTTSVEPAFGSLFSAPKKLNTFGENPINKQNTELKRWQFTGSVIQGLSVKKTSESSEFDRCRMYCDGIVSVSSSCKVDDNLVTGAVAAGYRMPKEPVFPDRHSWSCYDFNKYECVPQSWISTRNSIYAFKNVEGLNRSMFTTGTTNKRLTQYSFIKHLGNADETNWNIYM